MSVRGKGDFEVSCTKEHTKEHTKRHTKEHIKEHIKDSTRGEPPC